MRRRRCVLPACVLADMLGCCAAWQVGRSACLQEKKAWTHWAAGAWGCTVSQTLADGCFETCLPQVAADHAPALSDSSPTIQTVRSLWRLHKCAGAKAGMLLLVGVVLAYRGSLRARSRDGAAACCFARCGCCLLAARRLLFALQGAASAGKRVLCLPRQQSSAVASAAKLSCHCLHLQGAAAAGERLLRLPRQ